MLELLSYIYKILFVLSKRGTYILKLLCDNCVENSDTDEGG